MNRTVMPIQLGHFFCPFWASSTNSFFSFSSSFRETPERIGIILDLAMMGISSLYSSVTNRRSGSAVKGADEFMRSNLNN